MAKKWGLGIVASAAAIALGISSLVAVSSHLSPEKPQSMPAITTVQSTGSNNPSDGIKVHGDWKITVREQDGTLVEQREFKNALATAGKQSLSHLLTGGNVDGWSASFDGTGPALCDNPADSSKTYKFCMIHTIDADAGPAGISARIWPNSLTYERTSDETGVVLSGSFVPHYDGNINRVITTLEGVSWSAHPQIFTWHSLEEPLVVRAGQLVYVTITFTFS